MNDEVRALAARLLNAGFDDLPERERKVITRIAQRMHIARNVNQDFRDTRTFGEKIADKVAMFGGSWTFILAFFTFLIAWTLVNSEVLKGNAFDPYPYIFLNLVLSMLAAIQAPVIMMSQNRQAAKDRLTIASDYEVNLKAELEIMQLHEKIEKMNAEHIASLLQTQDKQLALLIEIANGIKSNSPSAS